MWSSPTPRWLQRSALLRLNCREVRFSLGVNSWSWKESMNVIHKRVNGRDLNHQFSSAVLSKSSQIVPPQEVGLNSPVKPL